MNKTDNLEQNDSIAWDLEPRHSPRKRRWKLIALVLVIGLLAVATVFLLQESQDNITLMEVSIQLNGESISPTPILYQSTDSHETLIDAQALLKVLEVEQQWAPYVASAEEVRFQNMQTNEIVYILNGWMDLQIYSPSAGTSIYKGQAAALVHQEKVYIPFSFVIPWLGIGAEYREDQNLLQLGSSSDTAQKELSEPPAHQQSELPEPSDEQAEDVASDSSESPISEEESSALEEQEVDALPGRIDFSYTYFDGDGISYQREGYAYQENDHYGFANLDGTILTAPYYARIGSPSQPELVVYQSEDGQTVGVISGWYRSDDSILYGVLSLEWMDWVIPCQYEDIYLEGDQCYGIMDGAGVQWIGEVAAS